MNRSTVWNQAGLPEFGSLFELSPHRATPGGISIFHDANQDQAGGAISS
jgi:hypothetical protein